MKPYKAIKIFLVLFTTAILFIGNVVYAEKQNEDKRIAVNLSENDQRLFLIEMRTVLGAIHKITVALSTNDMKGVAKAAQHSKTRIQSKSKELLKKLPPNFKVFSKSVRKGFKQIAKSAKSGASKDKIISQLSQQLGRCVACHSIYKLN